MTNTDPQNQRNWNVPVNFQHLKKPRIPERNPEACILFKQGKCWYGGLGGRCKYRHFLNQPITDMLGMGNWCKWSLQMCPYGKSCKFRHKFEDKRGCTVSDQELHQGKQELKKKVSFKWHDIEKISQIYADWIDLAPVY